MNLYNHLPAEDAVQFLISSLDSFLDNLPFDGVPCFSEWATCLNQIAKFAVEKEMSQQQQLQYTSTVRHFKPINNRWAKNQTFEIGKHGFSKNYTKI